MRKNKNNLVSEHPTIELDLVLVERSELERMRSELSDLKFAIELVIEAEKIRAAKAKQDWPPCIE